MCSPEENGPFVVTTAKKKTSGNCDVQDMIQSSAGNICVLPVRVACKLYCVTEGSQERVMLWVPFACAGFRKRKDSADDSSSRHLKK